MTTISKLPYCTDIRSDFCDSIRSGDEINVGISNMDFGKYRYITGVVGHVCKDFKDQVLEFSVLTPKEKKAKKNKNSKDVYRFERLEDGRVYCIY